MSSLKQLRLYDALDLLHIDDADIDHDLNIALIDITSTSEQVFGFDRQALQAFEDSDPESPNVTMVIRVIEGNDRILFAFLDSLGDEPLVDIAFMDQDAVAVLDMRRATAPNTIGEYISVSPENLVAAIALCADHFNED